MRRIYEPFAYDSAARAACAWDLPNGDWRAVSGSETAEFAIIGAGYTGLSAALHLARAGAGGVIVLEAESPGWGASGRNGGFCCLGGAMLDNTALARIFGADEALRFFHAQRKAIDLVADLIAEHGIAADTHSDGEVLLAHHPRVLATLKHEAESLGRLGVASTLISGEDLAGLGMAGPEFHGGLHIRLGFALDPGKYAAGLARAAAAAGAEIRVRSPATAIGRDNGKYRLTTPGGSVTARRLILATNGYSSEDLPGWMAGRYLPAQSSVLVTRPLTKAEQAKQGWTSDLMAYDSRALLHYFRLMPDGRFLFGMRGGIRADRGTQARMHRLVRRDFARMFPAWADVETPHGWSGLICMARGLTPYAGPLGDWENAWAGLAYHGNGVAMGTFTGALLADLALGRTPPLYPAAMRAPLGRFPLGRYRRGLLAAAYGWYGLRDRV